MKMLLELIYVRNLLEKLRFGISEPCCSACRRDLEVVMPNTTAIGKWMLPLHK